jgi:hypothetical protein
MSNGDENQGRRGLFRRNRPTEPVASAPFPDAETQNLEAAVGESLLDADRKQGRRPGLGRRKPAADGSWSSDAWEDGWDDDWSDRSSRAGVRPAADPRPAEVDAWLASSDDQLGDITRDIARKWTGNKQTEPVNAAITWADDVPAAPSRAFIDDPFVDERSSGRVTEPADSFASDDDLWDTPTVSSDWSSPPNDANEPVRFADDDLPVAQPTTAPVNLGSTWDDVETPVAAVEPVEVEPMAVDEPVAAFPDLAAQPSGPGTEAHTEINQEIAPSIEAEAPQPVSFVSTEPVATIHESGLGTNPEESGLGTNPEESGLGTNPEESTGAFPIESVSIVSVSSEPVSVDSVSSASVSSASVSVEAFARDITQIGSGSLDSDSMQTETPGDPSELAFDFAGSTDNTELPDVEAASVEGLVESGLGKNPEQSVPGTNPEQSGLGTNLEESPEGDEPTAEIPTTHASFEVDAEQPLVDHGTSAIDPVNEATFVQGHLDAGEIPESVESISAPIESVVVPPSAPEPLIQAASVPFTEPALTEPIADEAAQDFAAPAVETVEINQTQQVERDEFLDSLYEELDDDDVPAQRKVLHAEPSAQIVSAVAAEVEPLATNLAVTVENSDPAGAVDSAETVENVDPAGTVDAVTSAPLVDLEPTSSAQPEFAPAVAGDVNFAPVNHAFDRRVAEALEIPSAEPMVDSGTSLLVPQDPNADFDFGPDRPVYAPKVSSAIVPALIGATSATAAAAASPNPVVQEDDDLFPATRADRFGAALDQLDDDLTDPSGLPEPAKKGFLRGRKNRKAPKAEPLSASDAVELDEQTDLPVAPRPPAAAIASAISPDTLVPPSASTPTPATSAAVSALRDERTRPADETFGDTETEDDLVDVDDRDEYDDDFDDYPEEAYFSPKLTKLLARAGFLLVALAAIRMLVLVGLAVRDGASDAQGIQDVFHRVGSAFTELGLAHGLMLIVGIAMAAAPALLGDPYIDDESRSIGATFGIGLIAAIFGVFGGFAAARLAMRVNDIADLTNPGISSTTKWAKLAMNLVATAGLSLVAVVAAVRALGGDRPEQD